MRNLILFSLLMVFSSKLLAAPKVFAEKEAFETRIVERIQKSLKPFLQEKEIVINVNISVIAEEEVVPDELPEEMNNGVLALSKLGISLDKNTVMNKFFKEKKSFYETVEKIEVNLLIPDTARKKLESDLKPIVERILSSYKPIQAQVEISRFNSIKPPPVKVEKPKERTPLDYLEAFQIPVAMIAVSLLLFLLLIVYIRKFGRLEGEKLEVMRTSSSAGGVVAGGVSAGGAAAGGAVASAPSSTAAPAAAGGVVSAGGAAGSVTVAGGGGSAVVSGSPSAVAAAMPPAQMDRLLGFKQFEDMLENAPYKAASLIKDWVNLKSYSALLCLSVVPQHFGVEKIGALLKELDQDIRQQWKESILDSLPDNAYMVVNQYILSHTVENILVPPEPVEEELKSVLLDIKPEEAAKLAKENAEYGAIFANLFEPVRVARMFSEMDTEMIRQVSEASLNFTVGKARDMKESLQAAVQTVRDNRELHKSLFLQHSVELIREVGPAKETEIYQALAAAGEKEMMREAAEKNTPASVIGNLPEELLKQRLSVMPLTERAVLIASLDDTKKARFLDCFGQEGKLRDLINVQLEQIESDEMMMKKIGRQSERLWLEFISSTRTLIAENEEWKDQVESLVESWIDSFDGGVENVA